jgi:uncharacterized membrane protein YfhO
VEIPRFEDSWITAQVSLRRRQTLGSSLYQDGGWLLLVDGRPRAAAAGEGSFLTASLPAGERQVDLLYRPPAFLWGCLLAALGLAIGAAAWVPKPRKLIPDKPQS